MRAKFLLPLSLTLAANLPAGAQIITHEGLGGALLGAVAGGVLGNNIGNSNTWEGAAIGAGAGLILGNAFGDARRQARSGSQIERPGASGWRVPGTNYRPSSATTGALLGGLAGGVIGNNTGDGNTWRGVAIGAGAGYLLGALHDHASPSGERRASSHRMSVPPARPFLETAWDYPEYYQDFPPGPVFEQLQPSVRPATGGGTLFGPGGVIRNSTPSASGSQDLAPANQLFGR